MKANVTNRRPFWNGDASGLTCLGCGTKVDYVVAIVPGHQSPHVQRKLRRLAAENVDMDGGETLDFIAARCPACDVVLYLAQPVP